MARKVRAYRVHWFLPPCLEARTLQAEFMAALPELDGQARTVAARFAVTAAALELATRHGITGQSAGLAFPVIKQCFDTWLERNGTGKHEDRKILENAINFAQRYFDSQRFVIMPTRRHLGLFRTILRATAKRPNLPSMIVSTLFPPYS